MLWTYGPPDPAHFQIQKSADGLSGWTVASTVAGSVRIGYTDPFTFYRIVPTDSGGVPISDPSNVFPDPTPGVLNSDGTLSPFHYSVSADVPPSWQLFKSTDSGSTWTFLTEADYGFIITVAPATGTWLAAGRGDEEDNEVGGLSNHIVYNSG